VEVAQIKTSIINSLEKLTQKRNWDILLAFICCVYVLLIAFPVFSDLNINELINWQIDNPFSRLPDQYLNSSHEQKHQFRLTVPIIARLLHIKGYGIIAIQYASAFLLFLFCYKLSFKITIDKVTATLCTFLTANIYAGTIGIYDTFWHFDTLAILFLILALYIKNCFLTAFFILLASFTDERAFVASSLVFVYKLTENTNEDLSIKKFLSKKGSTILLSWLVYLVLRLYFTRYHNFFTGTEDISLTTIRMNYNMFPLNILFTFEFGWLLILLGLYSAKDDKVFLFIVLGATIVIFIVAMFVTDVSRSTAYVYPLLFIGLLKCSLKYKKYTLRKIILVSTIACIVIPTQEFFGFTVYGMGPIFPKIIKLFN
jgi:hypothetical protein